MGFGGLLAAGGYGSLSRAYGVLADHVVAARVVDAQGRLLTANSQANPGLFFAIRGGGGGTYGEGRGDAEWNRVLACSCLRGCMCV